MANGESELRGEVRRMVERVPIAGGRLKRWLAHGRARGREAQREGRQDGAYGNAVAEAMIGLDVR